MKVILSDEVTKQINFKTLCFEFLTGTNPNFQLWTLYALFIINIIVCGIAQINKKFIYFEFFDIRYGIYFNIRFDWKGFFIWLRKKRQKKH